MRRSASARPPARSYQSRPLSTHLSTTRSRSVPRAANNNSSSTHDEPTQRPVRAPPPPSSPPSLPPPTSPPPVLLLPRRAALFAGSCALCAQLLEAAANPSSASGATQQQQQQQAAARGFFERRRQRGVPRSSGLTFSYDRAAPDGPSRWPGKCNDPESRAQSPIDVAEGVLTTPAAKNGACRAARLDFSAYKGLQRGVKVRNVGFGFQVDVPPGNFLRVVVVEEDEEGKKQGQQQGQQQAQQSAAPPPQTPQPTVRRLELLQYHFHEPGEHAVSGRRGAMEAHLVHRVPSSQGGGPASLAVVALLLDASPEGAGPLPPPAPGAQGSASDALRVLLEHAPPEVGGEVAVPFAVDPGWLPAAGGGGGGNGGSNGPNFFYYRGSLTTPPCAEDVDWFVLATRAAVVPAVQVAAFRGLMRSLPGGGSGGGGGGSNARPLQPLNGRAVRFNCLGGGGGG